VIKAARVCRGVKSARNLHHGTVNGQSCLPFVIVGCVVIVNSFQAKTLQGKIYDPLGLFIE
jgi:hypothetical protein